MCNAGQIWFNNDFIGWRKDVLSMAEEVDKALTRCLMTPYRRFKNNHPHAAVNTVDQENGRGKSLQQNMIPFGDMFLMSSDSQGLIHDFITNNHNHSSIKKEYKIARCSNNITYA